MFRCRYDELIGTLKKLAFEPTHIRVMEYLKKKNQSEGVVCLLTKERRNLP